MYSHIVRSATRSLLGFKRYGLSFRIDVDSEELRIIQHYRLHRIEIFSDPGRNEYLAAAAASHAKAKSYGLFAPTARDATKICRAEIGALVSTLRAVRAFQIHFGDLLGGGVSINHVSLQAITEVEKALIECIDHIDHFVQTARIYSDGSEDFFAPGTIAPEPNDTHPRNWPFSW